MTTKKWYIYSMETLIALTTNYDDAKKFEVNIKLRNALLDNIDEIVKNNTKVHLQRCYESLNRRNTEEHQIFVVQLLTGCQIG